MSGADQYYFVHVMKTAGGTFKRHLRRNFPREQVYPPPVPPDDRDDINLSTEHLQSLTQEERDRYRVVAGHWSYATKHLLRPDVVTMTLLRDPVERTLSHVKLIQRTAPRFAGSPLEEVYDDPQSRSFFFDNYQVRVFAYDDPTEPTVMGELELDEPRLRTARKQFAEIDVFGFRERLDEFLTEVSDRYGIRIVPGVKDKNIAPETEVDPALRARIEADSAADIEFYHWARQLYEERRT